MWLAAWWFIVLAAGLNWIGIKAILYLFIYWLLPFATILQVMFFTRAAFEHGAIPDSQDRFRNTRTYLGRPIMVWLVAPLNVHYHLEHHLYPAVPFFRLPKLHKALASTYLRADACVEEISSTWSKLQKPG
jgi:fatty acid desaturase